MQWIGIAELQARHAQLVQDRQLNQEQMEACQEREHGFKYVLGELEKMIAELESREAAVDTADLAGTAAPIT